MSRLDKAILRAARAATAFYLCGKRLDDPESFRANDRAEAEVDEAGKTLLAAMKRHRPRSMADAYAALTPGELRVLGRAAS